MEWGQPLNNLGRACFFEALRVLKRVYWNINQKEWQSYQDGTLGDVRWFASHDGEVEPNFIYQSVSMSWYKNPGRSMRTNKTMTPDGWVYWLDAVITHLETFDVP